MIKTIAFLALVSSAIAADKGLLDAIEWTESRGDATASGDGGKAVGAYQIWPIMVKEVNRVSGKSYTLKDRLNKAKSREMCSLYLDWCIRINKHKGYALRPEQLAACWNGGNWHSWKSKKTIRYQNKIKTYLKGK